MKKALPLLLMFTPLLGCIGQVDGTGSGLPPGTGTGIGGKGTPGPDPGTGGLGVDVGSGAGGALTGGMGGGSMTAASGLPCEIQAMLVTRCVTCHGAVPSGGAPMSLVTYADLMAPARSNPSMTVAQLSLARMQNTVAPM